MLWWRLQVARSWPNLLRWKISPWGVKDYVLRQLSAMTFTARDNLHFILFGCSHFRQSTADWRHQNCSCLSQKLNIWTLESGWPWRSNMTISISYIFLLSSCTCYLSLTSVGNCLPRNASRDRTSQRLKRLLNHSVFTMKHARYNQNCNHNIGCVFSSLFFLPPFLNTQR